MVLDLCIFVSWFKLDAFFTGETNIMDRERLGYLRNPRSLKEGTET